MAIRLTLAMILAIIVTIALFHLMQALIHSANSPFTEAKTDKIVEFVRVKEELEEPETIVRPDEPEKPEELPPTVKPKPVVVPDKIGVTIKPIKLKEFDQGDVLISNHTPLPLSCVQPSYPRQPLARGQTGWVVMEFTVNKRGAVVDPVVVDNCAWVQGGDGGQCEGRPSRVFDRAALAAVVKCKYTPKVVEGEAMPMHGVRNKFTFELADE